MRHHGDCVWQSNEGHLSSDSEEMETGENVACIAKCWTCKEDNKICKQWGTGETSPTKNEHEFIMEEESEEGYNMFEETIAENESEVEVEEAVYEVIIMIILIFMKRR
jgi:hypothetical protein